MYLCIRIDMRVYIYIYTYNVGHAPQCNEMIQIAATTQHEEHSRALSSTISPTRVLTMIALLAYQQCPPSFLACSFWPTAYVDATYIEVNTKKKAAVDMGWNKLVFHTLSNNKQHAGKAMTYTRVRGRSVETGE